MADSTKRKNGPSGDARDNRGVKRSKGGSGGKWQTPHQKAKVASRGHGNIEPGDAGIWATCARGMEGRATEELKAMFEECAERFYGLVSGSDDQEEEEDGSVVDIESSIQKEMASMGKKHRQTQLFAPVHLDLVCVLFFKTRPPIDPVDFVHRICKEVVATPGIRRMRYVNRLTPTTLIGKATEKGLEEVGKIVLGQHFNLREHAEHAAGSKEREKDEKSLTTASHSYAIRPTTRNHNTLKRDDVIKQTAGLISNTHKVDLTTPEMVIIVEIYQTVCGMSVVGSDWEALKRFNLAELYQSRPLVDQATLNGEAKPQSVNADEAARDAVITKTKG